MTAKPLRIDLGLERLRTEAGLWGKPGERSTRGLAAALRDQLSDKYERAREAGLSLGLDPVVVEQALAHYGERYQTGLETHWAQALTQAVEDMTDLAYRTAR